MKAFLSHELAAAIAHAEAGGQALHLHRFLGCRARAPACFVRAVDRGEDIAHLFDRDEARLVRTAKALGVRVVAVERPGSSRQHVDLCGAPLRKAKAECERHRLIPWGPSDARP
jgi:hypothetical protein